MDDNAAVVWSAVAAVGALVSAVAAAVYTYFTHKLLLSQIQPCVVVTVISDPDRPTILMIRVRNIGAAIARDIRFSPSRPIPEKAWGLDPNEAADASPMKDGPLVDGIAALGPEDTRDITWGQFGGLVKAMREGPIVLKYSYKHEQREIKGQSVLEVSSFVGTDAAERPTLVVARSMQRLVDEVKGLGKELGIIRRALENVAVALDVTRKPPPGSV